MSRPPCWPLRWGGREPRPILSLVGFSELGEISVDRRRPGGPELKRPWSARRWEVRVLGNDGQPLCRSFRFRSAAEAERFGELLRSFAKGHAT